MTPLERAAAAVRDTLQKQADQSGSWITEQHPDTRVWSYEGEIPDTAIVRAVLTAIREPSSDMLGDVHDTLLYHISGQELDTARLVWDRFIEVLLEGGE